MCAHWFGIRNELSCNIHYDSKDRWKPNRTWEVSGTPDRSVRHEYVSCTCIILIIHVCNISIIDRINNVMHNVILFKQNALVSYGCHDLVYSNFNGLDKYPPCIATMQQLHYTTLHNATLHFTALRHAHHTAPHRARSDATRHDTPHDTTTAFYTNTAYYTILEHT